MEPDDLKLVVVPKYALVKEVERWSHTPVSVGFISAAETVYFYLLTTN